jgi:hypothetical protein
MGKEYKQLSVEERSVIAVGLGQGLSWRAALRSILGDRIGEGIRGVMAGIL